MGQRATNQPIVLTSICLLLSFSNFCVSPQKLLSDKHSTLSLVSFFVYSFSIYYSHFIIYNFDACVFYKVQAVGFWNILNMFQIEMPNVCDGEPGDICFFSKYN